jgi:hypothetical protein
MSPPEGALGKKAPGTCPAPVPGRMSDSDSSLTRSRSASGRAAVAEEVAAGDEGSHLGVGHAPGKHPESAVWVDELMPKLVPFDDDTDARSGSRTASNRESIWRFLTDRRDAPILGRIKTARSTPFALVDRHTPADLESCHATIADLSPRCIAA